MKYLPIVPSLLLFVTPLAMAQDRPAPLRSEEEILKTIKQVPEGFDMTVFASHPNAKYPTALSAAADGVLFVVEDGNGAHGREGNRSRAVRCVDTNGDGKADEFTTFAETDLPKGTIMGSARGCIWDGPSGKGPGTLYVMHAPNLTAYTDTDGDGKADKAVDIVTGIGSELKDKSADHATNSIRMGIDGYIYVAMGDYGFVEPKGTDGTTIKYRGGGIVRVRPDGTGLELVVRGTRNIYDVGVSPTLDLFTRDNNNDGGGWDVRVFYSPPGAQMGYPSLFKNFTEDCYPVLIPKAGGSSPTGVLWLDEPGMQNGLYTVEWGGSNILYQALKRDGAGFALDGPAKGYGNVQGQAEWIKMPKPMDMEVDAAGRIYVASWDGAVYNWAGPNVGYVLRLVKKGSPAPVNVDFAKATDVQLATAVGSASAVMRLGAQREILRRGPKQEFAAPLRKIVETPGAIEPRVAAIMTIGQLYGEKAFPLLAQFAADAAIREYAIRALGDARNAATVPMAPITAGLTDSDPRVRLMAVTAIRRLNKVDAAAGIIPLVADPDFTVAHVAVRALGELKPTAPLLAALDSTDTKVKPGVLRALYGYYDPVAVDGLITRLAAAKDPALRLGIFNTLCRLDNQEAPYKTHREWWGTRPDNSGPLFKGERWEASDKIEAALQTALNSASAAEVNALAQTTYKTKVKLTGGNVVELMMSKAGNDAGALLTAVEGLFGPENTLPDDGLRALVKIATDDKQNPELRAKAFRLLTRASERETGFNAAINAFAPVAAAPAGTGPIASAYDEFTRDTRQTRNIDRLDKIVSGTDAAKRSLALTVLVNLATSPLVKGGDKNKAEGAVNKNWSKPDTTAALLGVIGRTKASAYSAKVTENLKNTDTTVAEAALYASQALGLNAGAPAAPAALIGTMKYEDVLAAVQKGGDAAAGKDMYLRAGCVACHTVNPSDPPKGPLLSAVANLMDRATLAESILKPNAKMAQGFDTATFKLKGGDMVMGFVTRDGGDSVDVRDIAGQSKTLMKADIVERGKQDKSMMPEGLVNGFTTTDLANLLAYLESLKSK